MCQSAKTFGLQEENINISNPQGNTTTGLGTTERKRAREGGRMQCLMKKEDKSLIGVDNFNYNNYAFFAALAFFLEFLQFCLIHLSLASLAF